MEELMYKRSLLVVALVAATHSVSSLSLPKFSLPKVAMPQLSLPTKEAVLAATKNGALKVESIAKSAAITGACYAKFYGQKGLGFAQKQAVNGLAYIKTNPAKSAQAALTIAGTAALGGMLGYVAARAWNNWLSTAVEYNDWVECKQRYYKHRMTRRAHKEWLGSYFSKKQPLKSFNA